jgi:site-specific DNA-adenine methylase
VNGYYTESDFYRIKDSIPTTVFGKAVKDIQLTNLSYLGTKTTFDTTHLSKDGTKLLDKDYSLYHEKLKKTTILNKDYLAVISKFDSPSTFFYLDPPYENSSKTIDAYTDIDLSNLAEVLKKIKGKFLLSINDSPNIRKLFKDFQMSKVSTVYALKKRKVVELFFTNY